MKKSFMLLLLSGLSLFSCTNLKSYLPEGEMRARRQLIPVWIKNLDPAYDSGNLPIGLQSPLVHEGVVYAGHNGGFMQAFELENGSLLWSEKDGSAYHAGAVAHKDQIIYGTVQGRVNSRHAILGTLKYSVDLGASVETRGVIHKGRIFFQLRNHQVFCLDVETGKILWAYKRSVPYLTTLQRASAPVIYKDKVLVGFADGTFAGLSVDEGVLLFETKLSSGSKFVDVDNAAFIVNDRVYISSVGSPLSLLDPNTGKVLRTSDFLASRPPLQREDQLLFGTVNGELVLTDKNLNILKTVKISQGVVTSLAQYKTFYAVSTTDGMIRLFDMKTLEKTEEFSLGHTYSAVFGEMIGTGDYLAFISSRNRLYIFK